MLIIQKSYNKHIVERKKKINVAPLRLHKNAVSKNRGCCVNSLFSCLPIKVEYFVFLLLCSLTPLFSLHCYGNAPPSALTYIFSSPLFAFFRSAIIENKSVNVVL